MLAWLGTTVLTQVWLWLSWELAATSQPGPTLQKPDKFICSHCRCRHLPRCRAISLLRLRRQTKQLKWNMFCPLLHYQLLCSKASKWHGNYLQYSALSALCTKLRLPPADAKFQGSSFVFKYKTYNDTPRSPCNILWPAWLRYAKLNF